MMNDDDIARGRRIMDNLPLVRSRRNFENAQSYAVHRCLRIVLDYLRTTRKNSILGFKEHVHTRKNRSPLR